MLNGFDDKGIGTAMNIKPSVEQPSLWKIAFLFDILSLPSGIATNKKPIKRKVITTQSVMLTEKEMIDKLKKQEEEKKAKSEKKGQKQPRIVSVLSQIR